MHVNKITYLYLIVLGYAPMSPHLGYAMSGVQSEYPAGTYTPYPTGGYPCGGGGGYPATGYPSAPVSSGYSPGPCYSTMPPPQHAPPQPLDKPLGPKDDGYEEVQFIASVPEFLWKLSGKPPDLPIISSPVYCQCDALEQRFPTWGPRKITISSGRDSSGNRMPTITVSSDHDSFGNRMLTISVSSGRDSSGNRMLKITVSSGRDSSGYCKLKITISSGRDSSGNRVLTISVFSDHDSSGYCKLKITISSGHDSYSN
uniref:Uncharacterized protein n=1 Tax=Timema monikensis TaxID=170555 RepID=A0A7R9HS47_9NEOP|nr:unnamed protein product [Timema monikensis]